jgi:phosphoribosylanthranilate isomerase
MKVKICGITNKDDATWALNYGADFIGINLYKESPRHNSVASAVKWAADLPSFAHKVGIFVNADQKEIVDATIKLKLSGVQLHGDETADFVKALRLELDGVGRPVFICKAVRVADESSLQSLADYAPVVDYFLLDANVPGVAGGTGQTFNWDLAAKAKEFGKPVFLAGGLNPDNVAQAVKKVGPFGVDVASGVEKSPRKKDLEKMKAFIQNAKG